MEVDQYQDDVVRTLAAEFSGRLSRKIVARTVVEAGRDLQGRIQPDALGEMLHRLAHHRLDAIITART